MTPELLRKVNQEFDISAHAAKPVGPVWQILSAKGCFALKKTVSSPEKLVRTAGILSKIKATGFESPILPKTSQSNLPYFEFDNHYYQLFQWHPGQHPSSTEPDSIRKSARLFASLHQASSLVLQPEDYQMIKLNIDLEQRTAFLEETTQVLKVERRLNRIDRALLRWSDYFLAQARFSLSGLNSLGEATNYEDLTGFCHNDPAPRNIIIENGQWFLIDFELSAVGLFVLEIAKLTGRILQANNWNPSLLELVLKSYQEKRAITNWEKAVLPYLFCFPQAFWRICSQRFTEKLQWSERRFAVRFWKITNEERQRQLFLKSLLPGLPT